MSGSSVRAAVKGTKAGAKAGEKTVKKVVFKADKASDVTKGLKDKAITNVKNTAKNLDKKVTDVVSDGQKTSGKAVESVHSGKTIGKSEISGEFYIEDWTGYPCDLPKPDGGFRILEGEEYNNARDTANKINASIHKNRPDLKGTQIHEMHPVKFGGSPTDIDNKIALSPKEHAKYTVFGIKNLER